MIKVWEGQQFQYDHEIDTIKRMLLICEEIYKENGYDFKVHFLYSFSFKGVDFDCVVVSQFGILIIELKQIHGLLSGAENGHWKIMDKDGKQNDFVRNKNPYQQCLTCRSRINTMIDELFESMTHKDRAKKIKSGLCTYPEGNLLNEGGIKELIEQNKWFYCTKIDNIKTHLKNLLNKNKGMLFSDSEYQKIDLFFSKKGLSVKEEFFKTHAEYNQNLDEVPERIKIRHNTNSKIIAGPGSGKTRYIIERAEFLIREKQINSKNMAFVSFTNESAKEIGTRLCNSSLSIHTIEGFYCCGTIHNLCLKIIRENENFKKIGYKKSPEILSAEVSSDRIKRKISKYFDIDDDQISKLEQKISLIINKSFYSNSQLIDNFLKDFPIAINPQRLIDMIEDYFNELISNNEIDFESILVFSNKLLADSNFSKQICEKCKYLFVDEFQDISKLQFEIFYKLGSNGTFLNVVGDPAQSIYKFRGGDSDSFNWFEELDQTEMFTLPINYRSFKGLVDFSNYIKTELRLYEYINLSNIPNECSDKNKSTIGLVTTAECKTRMEEASFIVKNIDKLFNDNSNEYSMKDFAILYRNTACDNKYIDPLLKQKDLVPYRKNSIKFSEKPYVKKLFIVLEFLYAEKIHLNNISQLYKLYQTRSPSYFDKVIEPIFKDCSKRLQNGSDQTLINDFIDALAALPNGDKEYEYLIEVLMLRDGSDSSLSKYIFEFFKIFEKFAIFSDEMVLEEINKDNEKLLDIAYYCKDLREFKRTIENEFIEKNDNNGITITTLHGSKGLQWPVVYIIGQFENDNYFMDSDENQEDNLFYVGITRAIEKLFITYPKFTNLKIRKKSKYYNLTENYL
jgi:DNA helicase II / ATP-dependent DNA helicase PcrA